MKCLEKDRNRRYETASGLARDVERYIGGDAVEACPPTLGYRLRKFYGRNRAGASGSPACSWASLTPGPRASISRYQRAVRAERRLGYERDTALASEERAIAATREAARERDKVADANASLRSLADRQRRTLYASSMNLAQAAWESGDARRDARAGTAMGPKARRERPARIRVALLEPAGASGSAKRSPSGPYAAGGDGARRRGQSRRNAGGRGRGRPGRSHRRSGSGTRQTGKNFGDPPLFPECLSRARSRTTGNGS